MLKMMMNRCLTASKTFNVSNKPVLVSVPAARANHIVIVT